jgi:hypothetical protein
MHSKNMPNQDLVPKEIAYNNVTWISLGCSCLPKFGIRDHIAQQPTFFYDWLISDIDSLAKATFSFSKDLFLKDIDLCDNGIRVRDLYTGLRFQHDFRTDSNGSIEYPVDGAQLLRTREKYLRRIDRLIQTLERSSYVVFIRYEFLLPHDIKSHLELLASIVRHLRNRHCLTILLLPDTYEIQYYGKIVIVPFTQDDVYPWKAAPKTWRLIQSIASDYIMNRSRTHNG